jgi:hypothetical protein
MMRIALTALAFLPAVATAQSADSVPPRLQSVMTSLDQRSIVRVRLNTGFWAAGPFRGSDGASLEVGPYIGFAETPQRIPLAGTDSLWTRGTATGAMMWRGALLGTVLSAAVAAATATCEGKYCTSDVAKVAGGGAVAGALLGGFIGANTPRWRLEFGRTRRDFPTWALAGADTSAVSWQLWTAVAQIPYNTRIRLRMAGGPDLQGRFERATALGVQIRPDDWPEGPPPEAPAVAIRGLFERGDRGKELAILGGAMGLGIGMALAVDDVCGLLPGGEPTSRCGWRFLGHSVIGSFAGALFGRLIGQRITAWHRRF